MAVILGFANKLLVNVFEIYVIIQFFDVFLGGKVADERIYRIFGLFKVSVTLIGDYYMPYIWTNFLISLGSIFVLSCCYRETMKKRILATIGANFILALAETFIMLCMRSNIFDYFCRAENGESVALFLSRLIFWIVVVLIEVKKQQQVKPKAIVIIWLFGSGIILNTIGGLILLCMQENKNNLLELVSILEAGSTIYLLIYLYDCLVRIFQEQTQMELLKKEKEYYCREAELIKVNQEELEKFRHDWKNRIQVMQRLIKEREWEELKKYFLEVENKGESIGVYSNTGNILLDSIINSKLNLAEKKNISVVAKIWFPMKTEIENDDMIVLLGNLLDNALEANEKFEGEKKIEFILRYEEGCAFLHIQNTFDRVILQDKDRYLTRKKDREGHGVGIKSIQDTVKKYNGETDIVTKKDWFIVDIMMYV
jgi:hypothetical protein